MTTIKGYEDLSSGAAFMESAAMDLGATTSFLLKALERTSKLHETSKSSLEYTIPVDVFNPDHSVAFRVPLHVVIDPPALVSEMMKASLRNRLRLKGFQVVVGYFTQPRLVLLIGRRVAGQLFCSRDGDGLHLEIKKRPDARDMGNAVLALGRLEFNVHTPLGSARADGTQ
jgi:hypothetical protein